MYQHPPPLGFQSAYMHPQPPVVQSRHVGSYSLGITSPPSSIRHSSSYDYPPLSAGLPLVQSRVAPDGGAYYSTSGQQQQSQLNNPPLPAPGRQGGQFAGSPSTAPASGAAYQQQQQQSRFQSTAQIPEQENATQQQQLLQQPAAQTQKLQGSQSQQQIPTQQNIPQAGSNQIDINQAANFENAAYRGNKNGPSPYQKFQSDPSERFYYEQDLAATRQLQGGSRAGRGLASPIYTYDDIESDQRVRKPLDEEQEKKLQKLKNEKTKRELHIQELDYRIHILEQENHSLRNQMDQMRNDYKRLNQVYEEKYSHEIDRLRLENQDYENSNKQWANRFKDIEQKCDDLVSEKQDLDEENRRLGEKILKIQVLLHEQPIKNQVRYENSTNKYG